MGRAMRATTLAFISMLVMISACQKQLRPPETYCGDYDRHRMVLARNPDASTVAELRLENCVHHNADALSASSDSADTIARSVRFACSSQLTGVAFIEGKDGTPRADGLNKLGDYVEDEARLVVVQTRAAHCVTRPVAH
jgi:hypothetical protein